MVEKRDGRAARRTRPVEGVTRQGGPHRDGGNAGAGRSEQLGVERHVPEVRRATFRREGIAAKRQGIEILNARSPAVVAEGVARHHHGFVRGVVLQTHQRPRTQDSAGGLEKAAVEGVVGDGERAQPGVEFGGLDATPGGNVVFDGDVALVAEAHVHVVVDALEGVSFGGGIAPDQAPGEVHLQGRPEVRSARTHHGIALNDHPGEPVGIEAIPRYAADVGVDGNRIPTPVRASGGAFGNDGVVENVQVGQVVAAGVNGGVIQPQIHVEVKPLDGHIRRRDFKQRARYARPRCRVGLDHGARSARALERQRLVDHHALDEGPGPDVDHVVGIGSGHGGGDGLVIEALGEVAHRENAGTGGGLEARRTPVGIGSGGEVRGHAHVAAHVQRAKRASRHAVVVAVGGDGGRGEVVEGFPAAHVRAVAAEVVGRNGRNRPRRAFDPNAAVGVIFDEVVGNGGQYPAVGHLYAQRVGRDVVLRQTRRAAVHVHADGVTRNRGRVAGEGRRRFGAFHRNARRRRARHVGIAVGGRLHGKRGVGRIVQQPDAVGGTRRGHARQGRLRRPVAVRGIRVRNQEAGFGGVGRRVVLNQHGTGGRRIPDVIPQPGTRHGVVADGRADVRLQTPDSHPLVVGRTGKGRDRVARQGVIRSPGVGQVVVNPDADGFQLVIGNFRRPWPRIWFFKIARLDPDPHPVHHVVADGRVGVVVNQHPDAEGGRFDVLKFVEFHLVAPRGRPAVVEIVQVDAGVVEVFDDVVFDFRGGNPVVGRDGLGGVDVGPVHGDPARQRRVVAVEGKPVHVHPTQVALQVEDDAVVGIVGGGYQDGFGVARAGVGVDPVVSSAQAQGFRHNHILGKSPRRGAQRVARAGVVLGVAQATEYVAQLGGVVYALVIRQRSTRGSYPRRIRDVRRVGTEGVGAGVGHGSRVGRGAGVILGQHRVFVVAERVAVRNAHLPPVGQHPRRFEGIVGVLGGVVGAARNGVARQRGRGPVAHHHVVLGNDALHGPARSGDGVVGKGHDRARLTHADALFLKIIDFIARNRHCLGERVVVFVADGQGQAGLFAVERVAADLGDAVVGKIAARFKVVHPEKIARVGRATPAVAADGQSVDGHSSGRPADVHDGVDHAAVAGGHGGHGGRGQYPGLRPPRAL